MNQNAKPTPLSVDSLQDLYSELRGSRSAPPIMDARAHFLERQMGEALANMKEAYDSFVESRSRILRQDPEKQFDAKVPDRDRQIRRLVRKKEKAREILDRFEELMPQLQKLADREADRAAAKAEASETPDPQSDVDTGSDAEPSSNASKDLLLKQEDISDRVLTTFGELIGNRQLALVSSQFTFRPIADLEDVLDDAIYLLRKSGKFFMLQAEPCGDPSRIRCTDLNEPKNSVDLPRERLLILSEKRKLVLLLRK